MATSAFAPVPRRRAPGTPPARRLGRSLVRVLAWTAIGLGLGLALAVFGPAVAGYRSFTVLSGSMVPELQVGDLVVDEPLAASEIRRGDVITFPDPQQAGRLITHRVTGIRIHGTTVDVTTRGDANNTVEQVEHRGDGIGRPRRLPAALAGLRDGHVAHPAGRMGLLVLPALGLGFLGLRAVWRPRPTASRVRAGASSSPRAWRWRPGWASAGWSRRPGRRSARPRPTPATASPSAPDFRAPSANRSVILKSKGGTPGYVKQGRRLQRARQRHRHRQPRQRHLGGHGQRLDDHGGPDRGYLRPAPSPPRA